MRKRGTDNELVVLVRLHGVSRGGLSAGERRTARRGTVSKEIRGGSGGNVESERADGHELHGLLELRAGVRRHGVLVVAVAG